MSVRLRLTILYIGLLACTLALFGSFLYVLFYINMQTEMDESIAVRTQDIVDLFNANPSQFTENIETYSRGDYYIQFIDREGRVELKTLNMGTGVIPVNAENLASIAEKPPQFETIRVGSSTYRLRTTALIDVRTQRVTGFLQVARSLDNLENTMSRLRQVLVISIGVSLSVAAVLGSIVARRAFRPIDRMTRTARRIGVSGNLSERVSHRNQQDELGRLAATFNEMLDRLQDAYTRQDEALSAQRRFVADASHELRTPLTTIRGNLDLLTHFPDLPLEDRGEALSDALSESQRMSRLVDDLLFLARADAGQKLVKTPQDVAPIVRDVVRQARRLSQGQTIEVEVIDGVMVLGSADHIRQLLLILIDNALKYTPPTGTIRVSMRVMGDPPVLGIAVADTGPGIDSEKLPHIFDRFYRADVSRNGSGAGLGLAIAKWLTEQHGGAIEAASEQGRGSIFTVWLPALSQDEQDSMQEPAQRPIAAVAS